MRKERQIWSEPGKAAIHRGRHAGTRARNPEQHLICRHVLHQDTKPYPEPLTGYS